MSNFSMSLSSVTSSTSSTSSSNLSSTSKTLKSLSKNAVKSSPEYRNLRQQFFHLQSTHNSLKLVHEREMILAAAQKTQLQEQLQLLQGQLDESRKDQLFILNSEQEALKALDRIKAEHEQVILSLKSQITQLEAQLSASSEARYTAETELTKLKMNLSSNNNSNNSGYGEEFITSLLAEWKDRVMTLTNQKNALEQEIDTLKAQKSPENSTSNNDSESLRNQILSTYVSLESAQSVLNQRRAEAERLASRIGNVKILEEKYRDALIKIKRLESASATATATASASATALIDNQSNCDTRASTPPSCSLQSSASGSDLKLIQLTQELGALKESLAINQLAHSTLQAEFESSMTQQQSLQNELEESKKTISKLQNSLKVKDSTIANMKEQLDSTVNLLTETLKKKKQ